MAEPSSKPPRLFLIDGYSNIFRAFYAIRNLSNSRGEPTNAVYGFVQMLRKLLREEAPELVGVALDVGKTFRNEKFEDYKANRCPMPEDLASQLPWIRKVLEAYRIPILELAGYEADDVLGSLSCRAAEGGYDVVLVSADKDLMQLVEDFGVPPEKVVDVLALMGDSIDNIPGVPGIGEKGAKSLILEYGSLDELLARAGEITRKAYREGLLANEAQARLSKELSTIHTNLDIPFDPEALHHDPPDTDALRRLFTELEFFSLVEELGPADAVAAAAGGGGEEIPAALEEKGADLAILGTHGHQGFERLMVGSVALRVLHRAACNLLIVPPGARLQQEMTERREEHAGADWSYVSDEVYVSATHA